MKVVIAGFGTVGQGIAEVIGMDATGTSGDRRASSARTEAATASRTG